MADNNFSQQLAERALSKDRPLHIFTIPDALHQYGVKEIGLVELTLDEEMRATQRARGDAIKLASEYCKECLRMVDGQQVKAGDGSADRAMSAMHPKIRQLLLRGYAQLHQTKQDEDASFLQSHEVRVG